MESTTRVAKYGISIAQSNGCSLYRPAKVLSVKLSKMLVAANNSAGGLAMISMRYVTVHPAIQPTRIASLSIVYGRRRPRKAGKAGSNFHQARIVPQVQ